MATKSNVHIQRFCGDQITAEAFPDNAETKQILEAKKQKLIDSGFAFADLSERHNFDVYWLQPSSFGTHASIVFTSNGEHCVTAEIGWYTPGGQYHVIPNATWFKWSEHLERTKNMTKCGTVYKSCNELIEAGITAAKRFGAYRKYTNNCQNYCNCVLDIIGLYARWTDIGVALVFSNILAPVVWLGMKIREMFG